MTLDCSNHGNSQGSFLFLFPALNGAGFFCAFYMEKVPDQGEDEAEAAVTATLIADGQYHTLQIPLKDLSFWKGQIHMIRFDYFSAPTAGDTMFVKSFRLGN